VLLSAARLFGGYPGVQYSMPNPKAGARSLNQLDWLVSNLRWLLLVSVGIVTLLNPGHAQVSDPSMMLMLGLLLVGAATTY